MVLDPTKREVLIDTRVSAEVRRAREEDTHAFPRETIVVIRQGKQAVYVEDSSSLRSEVKDVFEGRSWKEIKEIKDE